MKHLVFGTGLVGGFLAGVLYERGFEARLVGREKVQLAWNNGLTISYLGSDVRLRISPQFLRPEENYIPDVVWLTVKCTAVDNSIEQLKTIVQTNTVIICCQNGFASDAVLRQEFPSNVVLNAVAGFNIAQQATDHLHRSTDGHLVVESHPSIDDITKQLNCACMPTRPSPEILAERWAKLQLNLSNPVSALADIPTKAMTEDRGYRKTIATLMRELLSVTKQMSLTLPRLTPIPASWLPTAMELPNGIYLRLAQKMLAIDPNARSSMWWDLSQGKRSEIMYLNQAVVDQADQCGIDCPANKKIVELVKSVEAGYEDIGFSAETLKRKLSL